MSHIDFDEIIATVLERGALTREELLEEWGLDTEQYAELRSYARGRTDVHPRLGRFGGIEVITPESQDLEYEEVEQGEWPEEALATFLEQLRVQRTIVRREIYEEMDIDETEDYKAFLDAFEAYCDAEDHVLVRKRGQGGIELKASPQEVFERLLEEPGTPLPAKALKELAGYTRSSQREDYSAFVGRLQALAEENGRTLIRKKGMAGVVLRPEPIDIAREVFETGKLAKSEIVQRMELLPSEYPRTIEAIFEAAEEAGLSIGSAAGRAGGLVRVEPAAAAAQPHRRDAPTPVPAVGPADYRLQPWEQAAVEALIELGPKMLEEAVGPALYNTIRGMDGSRSSRALATALVLKFGLDLFAEKTIRDALAEIRGVESPKRWRAGGRAAQEFIEAVGLPPQFAGEKREERQPDIETLDGKLVLGQLEDYQTSVKDQMLTRLHEPATRAMVSLPTGAGKTRVAVETLRELLTREASYDNGEPRRQVVLWLAHTEELCEQACRCIRQVWENSAEAAPISLVRFWGDYSTFSEKHEDIVACLTGATIIVSTPQRLDNVRHKANVDDVELAQSFLDRLRARLRLILIDEAHRAAAPIYRRIFEYFQTEGVGLVGLTATPFRNVGSPELGAQELQEIFQNLVEPTQIDEHHAPDSRTLRMALQARGVLARPRFDAITTDVSMGQIEAKEDLSLGEIEAIDKKLARRADSPRRRRQVLARLEVVAKEPGTSVIYFGPTVNDAEVMTYLLRRKGIAAAVLSGESKVATRRQVIKDFKSGKLTVLCNCEVLTTGFDSPRITHVVVARPTMSQVLYEQMVGRGLRGTRFQGTDECFVLDVVDSFPGGKRPVLGHDRFREAWGSS